MTDKTRVPVSGGGPGKGKPDGVSGSPETGEAGAIHGRQGGGESGGGAYPNPHSGKGASGSALSDHGGQSEIAYYGGDNPNATTTGATVEDNGLDGIGEPERREREATGNVKTDGTYERE